MIQAFNKGDKAQRKALDFQIVYLLISHKDFSFILIFMVSEFLMSLYGKSNNKEVQ